MFQEKQFTGYVTITVNTFTCFLIKLTNIFENYLINVKNMS